jgi:predicted secreted protein
VTLKVTDDRGASTSTAQRVEVSESCGWEKTFGGSGDDEGFSVQQTKDGGYILLGETGSFGAGGADFWLIKTDARGNKEWEKTFGGSEDDGAGWLNRGLSVQQTKDGGYILLGTTSSFGAGDADFWLIKTDARGNKEWERTFGGSSWDRGYSVQQTKDGGYILLGETGSFGAGPSDFWLIKTDARGKKQWDKTLGGWEDDYGLSVQQTKDGGYILLGWTGSFGEAYDFLLIKTDAQGDKEWEKTFGGSQLDQGYSVQQTSDGGYILLGETYSFGAGYADFWLIKTDAWGNKQWERTFGGRGWDWGYSVQQTKDGGYILLGDTGSFGAGGGDFWLIKTDAQGNKQWDKTFGGSGDDVGLSVQQTSDGGYILLGYTYSFGAGDADFWLIKYCPEE